MEPISDTVIQERSIKNTPPVYTPANIFLFILKFVVLIAVMLSPLIWIILVGLFRVFVLGPFSKYEEKIPDIANLKKGDIILTGKSSVNHSWYIQASNALTRKLKHRFWVHAAIYAGDGKIWEALPGKNKGVIQNDLSKVIDEGYLIRAFRHKYVQDEMVMNRVIEFCQKEQGSQYGVAGIVFYVFSTLIPLSFNWLFDDPIIDKLCGLDNAYFCSELVVDAYRSTGHEISPFDGWRVKPCDFISNQVLEPVY